MLLFREEIKRFKLVKENKDIFNYNEFKDIILDTYTILKDKGYNLILKILSVLDNKKVKY